MTVRTNESTDANPGFSGHPDQLTLSVYVDGRVSPRERGEIEDHLTTCRRCQDHVAALFAVIGLLGGLDDVAPPRSFRIGDASGQDGATGAPTTPGQSPAS